MIIVIVIMLIIIKRDGVKYMNFLFKIKYNIFLIILNIRNQFFLNNLNSESPY